MQIKHILTVILIAVFFNSTAQITGIVTSQDANPIEGVSVMVADSINAYTLSLIHI